MKEKHVIDFEFWNCVVQNCESKFIRREYLFKHLEQINKFPVDDARKAALKATRGVDIGKGYSEEVSDYATILDLIDDISDVNSVNELRNSWSNLKKRQGKGQDNIQSNHQDENNNYAEDVITSISSDDEMINEERGLEVSDKYLMAKKLGVMWK